MPGLLDSALNDPLSQLGIGLLGGQSSNFGQNLAQAMQFAQAQKVRQMQEEHLHQQMLAQKLAFEEHQRQQQQGEKDRGILQGLPAEGNTTFDRVQKQVEYMQKNGASPQAIKPYLDLLEKFRPKAKADQQMVKMPDGSLGLINILDDGSSQVVPYKPAEKLKELNLGGSVGMVGEYSGNPNSVYRTTMTPGQVAQDQRSRETLAQSERHFQAGGNQYDAERGVTVNTRTGEATPVLQDGKPIGAREKAPAENELTAAGYAGRMAAAENIFGTIGPAGQPNAKTFIAANLPKLDPVKRRAMERAVMSPQQQQYRQAQEDWVRAKLRKESGAVIADDEMQREIETYFPQIGDSPEVIQQKARSRATALQGMTVASGKAENRVSSVSGARPPLASFGR